MNGDQQPESRGAGLSDRPVDNPPSLSEPVSRTSGVAPSPMVSKFADSSVMTNKPESPGETAVSDESSDSFYNPEGDGDASFAKPAHDTQDSTDQVIEWVSSGEDLQAKAAAWRVRMIAIALIAGAVIFALTRDFASTGIVIFAGLLFGFIGARKPPATQYHVDRHGITIGQRQFAYSDFRAFSLVNDPHVPTISIVPLKRFAPLLSIRCDPQQIDRIVAVMSSHLPLEAARHDAIDSIVNRIKV